MTVLHTESDGAHKKRAACDARKCLVRGEVTVPSYPTLPQALLPLLWLNDTGATAAWSQ